MRAIDPEVQRLLDEIGKGIVSRRRILTILERLEWMAEPRAVNALAGLVLSEGLWRRRSNVASRAERVTWRLLGAASPAELSWIDDRARSHPWWSGASRPVLKVDAVRRLEALGDEPEVVLGLASMDRDGYVREEAVRRLAARRPGCALPFLILRLHDWVRPVRDRAWRAIEAWIENEDARVFVPHLPLLRLVRRWTGRPAGPLVDRIEARIAADAGATGAALDHEDPAVRRIAVEIALDAGRDECLGPASGDPDDRVRLTVASRCGDRREILRRLLADRHPVVRVLAVDALAEARDPEARDLLAAVLPDRSAAVRHSARFYLETRHGQGDFARAYRLLTGEDDRRLPGAVAGLGETGDGRTDRPVLRRLLEVSRSAVARRALRALVRLDSDRAGEILHAALLDRRPGVVTEARRMLEKGAAPVEAAPLMAAVASESEPPRRAAVRLLPLLGAWDALCGLLALAADDSEVVRAASHVRIRRWIHDFHHALYAPIPPDEAQRESARGGFRTVVRALPADVGARLAVILADS